MEIHLKEGIDAFQFGMTPDEIIEQFGEPDVQTVDSEDENEIIWVYNKYRIRLSFFQDENESLLGYIRCSNPNLKINGTKVFDEEIDTVLKNSLKAVKKWETDEYDLFVTYFNSDNWLTLNVEYNHINGVEMGVPFDE